MNTLPTNIGTVTPEHIVDELIYQSFAAQRSYGMSAEAFGRLLHIDPTAYEARYQSELGRVLIQERAA